MGLTIMTVNGCLSSVSGSCCHIFRHHLIMLPYSTLRVFYWTSFRRSVTDLSHIPQVKRDLERVWVSSFHFINHTATTSLQRTRFKCLKGLEFKEDHQWSRDPWMTWCFIIIRKPNITASHKFHICTRWICNHAAVML